MARVRSLYYVDNPVGATVGPTGFAGVDSTSRHTTEKVPLGTKGYDSAGNEYTFVKAGATIAVNDAVTFQGSAAGYDDVRPTSARQQMVLGAATAAFTTGQYGFILTRGVATVKVVVATAAGSLLVSSGTAGTLALAVEADAGVDDLAGARGASALVTGVAAGSAVYLA